MSPDNYVKASLPGWFVLGEQQDSSEYLRFILDGVHEAVKAHDNQKGQLASQPISNLYLHTSQNFLYTLFGKTPRI